MAPNRAPRNQPTPVLDTFLTQLAGFVRARNAAGISDWLRVNPPYDGEYARLIGELRAAYAQGHDEHLQSTCERALPEAQQGDEGASWSAFVRFMVQYLVFLRDVDPADVRQAAEMLNELTGKCNGALSHPTLGILMLPSTIQYSRVLAELTIRLKKERPGGRSVDGESPYERAANTIRNLAQTCLMDRSAQPATGRPEGKKAGLYRLVNICLRLMFQCGLVNNTQQIFTSIQQLSPPLDMFPAADRVTYLYYLGRYHLSWNDFNSARLALGEAYRQCHPQFLAQRRRLLVPLIASNVILGIFPSNALLQRPEAQGLADVFVPICQTLKYGHISKFRRLVSLSPDTPHGDFLFRQKILYQMQNRCLVIAWRSLLRRVFLLSGVVKDAESRAASTLNLQHVLACMRWLDLQYPDPADVPDRDFEGTEGYDNYQPHVRTMWDVECIVTSLVHQGFMNGFISHKTLRFAILGARKAGPLRAGFPNYWAVLQTKVSPTVPGWKRETPNGAAAAGAAAARSMAPPKAGGPGSVVKFSGGAMQPFAAAGQ